MVKQITLLLVILALPVFSNPAFAATFNLSTGYQVGPPTNTKFGPYSKDPYWMTRSIPGNASVNEPAWVYGNNGTWWNNIPDTRPINGNFEYIGDNIEYKEGAAEYERCFCINDLEGARLTMELRADNIAYLFLNSYSNKTVTPNNETFRSTKPSVKVDYTVPQLKLGKNCLRVRVDNEDSETGFALKAILTAARAKSAIKPDYCCAQDDLFPKDPITKDDNWTVRPNHKGATTFGYPPGYQTVPISLPQGKIKVFLPDDMAAGDTVSGTVSIEPNGTTDSEKAQNRDSLSGYVIDLGGEKSVPAGQPGFVWTTAGPQSPVPGKDSTRMITITGPGGQPLGSASAAVSGLAGTVSSDFAFPSLGQTGRAITITGPFDGNSSNTSVSVGGIAVGVIAESPRKVVVATPVDVTGATEIQLKEKDMQKSAPFRNVGVKLSVPKLNLTKGEKTTLTVNVNGLQGITSAVSVQLVATGTVIMQGGNTQNFQVPPGQVQATGGYSQAFELTGTAAGAFNVTANVLTLGSAQPGITPGMFSGLEGRSIGLVSGGVPEIRREDFFALEMFPSPTGPF